MDHLFLKKHFGNNTVMTEHQCTQKENIQTPNPKREVFNSLQYKVENYLHRE